MLLGNRLVVVCFVSESLKYGELYIYKIVNAPMQCCIYIHISQKMFPKWSTVCIQGKHPIVLLANSVLVYTEY